MNTDKKLCIVDRIEGEWAVVEYGKVTFNIPKELLPADTSEGDVVDISVITNHIETDKRKKMIDAKFRKLFKS